MKRLLMLTILIMSNFASAQDYYHGLGGQINYGLFNTKSSDGTSSSLEAAAVPGIVYKASLGFDISRSTSFAISSYPFIGLNASVNSNSGLSSGSSFGAEFPVLGEIYFGDLDDGCFFLGAGFSAAFVGTAGSGSGSVFGPQLDLGGQFYLRDRLIGLRLAYTYGVNRDATSLGTKTSKNLFGLGFYYVLGQ